MPTTSPSTSGSDRGTLRKLDVYPAHKEVVVAPDPELILEAINDRGVTRLLVPDRAGAAPELARETRHSAQRRIRTALVYTSSGDTADGDVVVRGSAQSDAFINAMMAAAGRGMPSPAQRLLRVRVDAALGLLPRAPG